MQSIVRYATRVLCAVQGKLMVVALNAHGFRLIGLFGVRKNSPTDSRNVWKRAKFIELNE